MANKLQCKQCSKSMMYKSDLARHMLTHSGAKTHTCSKCKKSFGLASNLRKHLIIHTEEREYACVQCQRAFGQAEKAHPQWSKDSHLLRMQEVIWSSRTFEVTHDHPQQSLCPMPKVIWSNYIFKKTHAHSQWSERPLLLRM